VGDEDVERPVQGQRVRRAARVALRRHHVELAEALAGLYECGQSGCKVTVVVGDQDAHARGADCRHLARPPCALRIIAAIPRGAIMASMHAWLCEQPTGVESVQWKALPLPGPGAQQVRIAIRAASLNFPDILIVQNKYQFKPDPPFVPGSEYAGVVDAV